MRYAAAALSMLTACTNLEPVSPDAPCDEVGFAISRRTFECTGDHDLSNARYQAFTREYECIPVEWELEDDDGIPGVDPQGQLNYFDCAFTIGELACELVDEYGDDLPLWMESSTACPLVVERK